MTRWRAIGWGRAAVFAAVLTAACGAPLLRLPSGPGDPASDAPNVIAEAARACRDVSSLAAAVAVRGSIGGRRVRGTLEVGLASPASARLDAVAPFGLLFTFVARGDDATLVLHREGRVLERGRPEAVLEAVTGVPLDAADLRTTLTGCVVAPAAGRARQIRNDWRIVPDRDRLLYFRREGAGAPWRLKAAVNHNGDGPEWRAEYDSFEEGLPRSVRLVSSDRDRFDLRLRLSQVDVNVALGPDVFEVRIPSSADPISLEELRRVGPLAAGSS